ncbi:thioesterase II family protein [Paenibacillus sp. MDMC362]|uniref:thioesterase II family protein n=1 Tax=Paenibacillus sp. MDMC362 TaxID=2977365 RepID=UPI000DC5BBF1|nr:alpha/beta fold hydrolase [Paenibacillus sp. MDMC362]RAR40635.1 hypothetical protein DP091_27570 [Paenibacillus sp. MDMC362]
MILFCIPYAGGSSKVFSSWADSLTGMRVIPIDLAGHGSRLLEPPYPSFDEAVEDIINQMMKFNVSDEFSIFGHSLGGILAYHVCLRLHSRGFTYPRVLFISSTTPNRASDLETIHALSDEKLVPKLRELGGIPREIMENEKLLKLFLPVIKRDLRLLESADGEVPLQNPCRLVVLYGMKDEFCKPFVHKWESLSNNCIFHRFSGDHFYLFEEADQLFEVIHRELHDLGSPSNAD